VVERLSEFPRERAVTLPELAMGWTLAHPAVDVAIVGARRPSHLEGTAAAAALALSPEDLGGIDAVLAVAVAVRVRTPKGCDEASRT
jgi:aryl-alcohol dehydrogenase-like predicted oxidoreductase